MLGARDAYLAADQMAFGGANQVQIWHAFAQRGFGQFASTASTNDTDPATASAISTTIARSVKSR